MTGGLQAADIFPQCRHSSFERRVSHLTTSFRRTIYRTRRFPRQLLVAGNTFTFAD